MALRGLQFLGERLLRLAGGLIKPVQAGLEGLPRLWALLTGKKTVALYQQDFRGLDLKDLLCAVNSGLPGSAGKKERYRVYVPVPGTVTVTGKLVWLGKN
ncbi:hypothetical protein FACS1894137_08540 [Spirochaetia bacterium]|nr:hypothetical protein FACS1894137_08540 [Spirochaetia bacterium]